MFAEWGIGDEVRNWGSSAQGGPGSRRRKGPPGGGWGRTRPAATSGPQTLAGGGEGLHCERGLPPPLLCRGGGRLAAQLEGRAGGCPCSMNSPCLDQPG